MTQDNTNDTHWPAPCAQHGLSDDFRHSKPDGLPCPEGCECCRGDGSCGECRGDYVCESRNGTGDGTMTTSGGAYGICISCDAKFAGDQATIDRCKAEAGWGFEHHGYHYDNTCQIHHPVDSGDPCSHLCTESCSVCAAPCMAGGLASEECKACAETTNCEACISCQMNASLFKANSTDFTNGTNFTMPDCGQCIDASSECGECMRRCGSCIGNNDPFALNSDGEPCAACDACTQWIPCALSSGPAPGDNARNEMKFCTQDNTPVYARVSRLFFVLLSFL